MNIIKNKKAISLIETLLVLAVLSLSFIPFAHIIVISHPVDTYADDEYLATLLANHVIESIIAKRAKDPSYLPSDNGVKSVVSNTETQGSLSEFFDYFEEFKGPVSKKADPQLYWAINNFNCKVNTYLIDDNLFKVVVFIMYKKDGQEMKVYLERLFSQNANTIDEIKLNGED